MNEWTHLGVDLSSSTVLHRVSQWSLSLWLDRPQASEPSSARIAGVCCSGWLLMWMLMVHMQVSFSTASPQPLVRRFYELNSFFIPHWLQLLFRSSSFRFWFSSVWAAAMLGALWSPLRSQGLDFTFAPHFLLSDFGQIFSSNEPQCLSSVSRNSVLITTLISSARLNE